MDVGLPYLSIHIVSMMWVYTRHGNEAEPA